MLTANITAIFRDHAMNEAVEAHGNFERPVGMGSLYSKWAPITMLV